MKYLQSYKLFESGQAKELVIDFDAWFDKSKVSNDGKPVVVYHGTNHKFDKFDMAWQGMTDDGFYGRGFYFTSDKEEAKEYGNIVMETYLKVMNPFYLRTYSSIGSVIEFDLRDDLAKLNGMPKDLKTVRTLPDGYSVKRSEEDNYDKTVTYTVHPDPKFYGTDKEIYGPDAKFLGSYDIRSS